MTQLAPEESAAGQVFVCVNSALVAMLVSVTLTGAVLDSLTVWVLGTPTKVPLAKTTFGGVAVSAGFTVRLAITAVDPVDAVMATVLTLVTAPAVTVNDWLLAPAGTWTDTGTGIAPGSLLARLTARLPEGAAPVSETVPVVTWSKPTVAGLNDNPLTTAAFTVRTAFALLVPNVAVTTTFFDVETLVVAAAKLCDALPAATTMLAGRVTEGSELVSATVTPPEDAAAFRATLPVDPAPPVTDVGLKLTDERDGAASGVTVSVPMAVVVPVVATTMAICELLTEPVATENDCTVDPVGTITLAGTGTAVELLVRATGNPPEGAIAFNVTVQVDIWPALTLAGLNATAATAGGLIVRIADLLEPLNEAVVVALAELATATVWTTKLTLVAPAGTVTVAGTDMSALLLARATVAPGAAAADVSTTVALEDWLPVTTAGAKVTELTCGGSTASVADTVW